MNEIFGKTGWANPKAIASEAGPCDEQKTVSDSSWTNNDNKKISKKRKIDTILEDFISEMKDDKIQREKKKR